MRAAICVLLTSVSIASLAGCRPPKNAQEQVKDDDREYELLIAGKSEDGDRAMEARQYLAPNQPKNSLWKTTREQTSTWVEELYQAGAVKVYAVYMPAEDAVDANLCTALLVELPRQPQARLKVVQAINRIDKKIWGRDHEKVSDEGQKFLFLDMNT